MSAEELLYHVNCKSATVRSETSLSDAAALAANLLAEFAHLLPEFVNKHIVDNWIGDVVEKVAVNEPAYSKIRERQKAEGEGKRH